MCNQYRIPHLKDIQQLNYSNLPLCLINNSVNGSVSLWNCNFCRLLASKFEELQRSARNQAVMSESVLKENDLLRYRIEEMESSTSEGEPNSAKTDCAV